jgi:hypothetical protein
MDPTIRWIRSTVLQLPIIGTVIITPYFNLAVCETCCIPHAPNQRPQLCPLQEIRKHCLQRICPVGRLVVYGVRNCYVACNVCITWMVYATVDDLESMWTFLILTAESSASQIERLPRIVDGAKRSYSRVSVCAFHLGSSPSRKGSLASLQVPA